MRVLFVMIARGGSKGVPGKNLRRIADHSLIGYKALGARRSRYCTRILLSTDSPEIAAEAERYGVEAPFLRPAELATDSASSDDVLSHAVDWVAAEGEAAYDAVMLLEPSTPFTRPADYDGAIEMLRDLDAGLVVGMREVEVQCAFVSPLGPRGGIAPIVERIESMASLRRQDLPTEYTMNGGLYVMEWDFFRRHRRRYVEPERSYGYVMDPEYSIEIDAPIDLAWGEFLVERGIIDLSHWA